LVMLAIFVLLFFGNTLQVKHVLLAMQVEELEISRSPSWTNIGPYGGSINCMAMSQTDPNTIYAGIKNSLYKTVDGCASWTEMRLFENEILVIQIDPANHSIVYVATDDGLYKSEDGSETWAEMGLAGRSIKALAIDPNLTNVLYAGMHYDVEVAPDEWETEIGIFKCLDGGETWEKKVSWKIQGECGWKYIEYILVDFGDSSCIYACGQNNGYCPEFGGFLRSTDGGETWEDRRLSDSRWDVVTVLAKPPTSYNPQLIYAVGGAESASDLYKSTDRGDNWIQVECPSQVIDEKVLAVDPVDPQWVYIGTTDTVYSPIWIYNNYEDQWYYLKPDGLLLKPPTCLLLHPQEIFLFYAGFQDGGVYKLISETLSWEPSNQGMDDVTLNALGVHPHSSDTVFAAGEGFGYPMAKTEDGGISWDHLESAPSKINVISFSAQDPPVIFVGKSRLGYGSSSEEHFYIQKSTDGGHNWTSIEYDYCYDMWSIGGCCTRISEILINENNPEYILVGSTYVRPEWLEGSLFRTLDGGTNWDDLQRRTTAMALDPSNPGILYVGSLWSNKGRVFQYTDIWGAWTANEITATQTIGYVQDIEVDFNSQVYAATSTGLMKWDGSEWTELTGLPEANITSIAIDKDVYPGIVYAGTGQNGVYVSQDGGITWEAYNNGLENLKITMLSLSQTQPKVLYALANSGGAWRINVNVCVLMIEAEPGGTTDPVPGEYTYDDGTEVTIEASPDEGYRFNGWSGDVPAGHENDNPLTITMDGDKSVNAHFVRQYTLNIAAGTGGTTDPEPGGYIYDQGTEVTITANPGIGYGFSGWNGDVPSGHENNNPLTITMDGDKTIAANFIRLQYTLTISSGSGGTTEPSPGTYTYDYGTNVTVSAIADSGYQFDGWSGDATGTSSTITITIDSDKSITARFKEIPPPPPNGQGGACFIATAAYGSPLHPHLDILRDFRDRYLMPSKLGRILVECYYKYSPAVADLIAEHKALKWMVRVGLLPLVGFSYSLLHLNPVITAVITSLRFN